MKVYKIGQSLAFTTTLIFGFFGIGFILVSISEGTFYKALWVHGIYFLLLFINYILCEYGTYIVLTKKTIRRYTFFIGGRTTNISDITSLSEFATYAGAINNIVLHVQINGKKQKRGLTTKEILSKEELHDLIGELKRINPTIQIPQSILE